MSAALTRRLDQPLQAGLQLFLTGDYTGGMRATLGEEDSPLVDIILRMREALFG